MSNKTKNDKHAVNNESDIPISKDQLIFIEDDEIEEEVYLLLDKLVEAEMNKLNKVKQALQKKLK